MLHQSHQRAPVFGHHRRQLLSSAIKGLPVDQTSPWIATDPPRRRRVTARGGETRLSTARLGPARPAVVPSDIDAELGAAGSPSLSLCRRVTKISAAHIMSRRLGRPLSVYPPAGPPSTDARLPFSHRARVTFKCRQRTTLGSTLNDSHPSVHACMRRYNACILPSPHRYLSPSLANA